MIILNILIGLLGLGLVILVHELGHFGAAKAAGIGVEAFSIGWGKVLYRRRFRETEYRISLLPIGGYCKMRGEEFFRQDESARGDTPPADPGSLFAASPFLRIFTYFAGPLANFVFSVLALSVIWFAGFTVSTFENKVILQSETALSSGDVYPSDTSGMQTGDVIVEIDGRAVESFRDIEKYVTPAAGKELNLVVDRNGRLIELRIVPDLDTESGAGKIGVAAWVDPLVAAVADGSDPAGIAVGDRIVGANGVQVRHSLDLFAVLEMRPKTIELTVERSGTDRTVVIPVHYSENGEVDLGFSFATMAILERERNPFVAFGRGVGETFETLKLSVTSIGLLFKGVNVRSAVSGPIRITYFVGQVASQGFDQGLARGFIILFRFLSMLSVALCFMNLLPIPALDGGFIVISVMEILFRRPIRPKFFFRYQIVGFAIIFAILMLTLFNDVFYLIGR
jgi:regulator of sigma E protease